MNPHFDLLVNGPRGSARYMYSLLLILKLEARMRKKKIYIYAPHHMTFQIQNFGRKLGSVTFERPVWPLLMELNIQVWRFCILTPNPSLWFFMLKAIKSETAALPNNLISSS